MSNEKNDIQTTEDAEFVMEDAAAEAAPEETLEAKPRRSSGIAWLAVFLAAGAFAGVAYTLVLDWMGNEDSSAVDTISRIEALDRRVTAANDAVVAVDSKLGQITHPDYSAQIGAVQRDVDEQLGVLNSLPPRMTSLENSVASLAGISTGARETFLLAEAEYYLQIANAQLQLANNPHLAALALGMADERVTQMSDPGLTDVRRAISDELQALEVMEKPDLEGATLKLSSLARVTESLPIGGANSEADSEQALDAEGSGATRAWASVKDAMSGLVKVTPPDQAKLAVVSPDAEYFLRNNIALQLQAARLALLRGEQAIFEQSLDDASALLNTYFDTSSDQVTSAQLTISEIRNGVFATSVPDISDSLRLLRQFRTLRETIE